MFVIVLIKVYKSAQSQFYTIQKNVGEIKDKIVGVEKKQNEMKVL